MFKRALCVGAKQQKKTKGKRGNMPKLAGICGAESNRFNIARVNRAHVFVKSSIIRTDY